MFHSQRRVNHAKVWLHGIHRHLPIPQCEPLFEGELTRASGLLGRVPAFSLSRLLASMREKVISPLPHVGRADMFSQCAAPLNGRTDVQERSPDLNGSIDGGE